MSWNYGNTPELYKEVEILLKNGRDIFEVGIPKQ